MRDTGDSNGHGPQCQLPHEDIVAQLDVLRLALREAPRPLTIFRASREINDNRDFARFDTVERAVRDLVAVGLLHCGGASIRLKPPQWRGLSVDYESRGQWAKQAILGRIHTDGLLDPGQES